MRELCNLDFHWIRLHYLYPDEITDELIDTIAPESKVLKYVDLPIQHCNDTILKAMNRRDTKAELTGTSCRSFAPGFRGWCCEPASSPDCPMRMRPLRSCANSCRETRIERAGVFPFSPEEGTRAARWTMCPRRRRSAGRS